MGRASRRRRDRVTLPETDLVLPPWPRVSAVPLHAAERLRALEEADEQRRECEARIRELALLLAESGVSWGDIGRALGISRQGARQRFQ